MTEVNALQAIRVFDTTLRDGEQSPGASMTSEEKLEVAVALGRLGVDVIEAGFPAASHDDLAAVARVSGCVGQSGDTPTGEPPIICALARAVKCDIDAAWAGVKAAQTPRIHTFLATSHIHLEHKLRMTRPQVLDKVGQMVTYARSLCADIEFSAEDAGRTDPQFLCEVFGRAIEAGATTLNIPDTVGYTTPNEFGQLVAHVITHTPGIRDCIVSCHCHNDLGLATANSLAALSAGARQVEVAINGIGERAGNASLEEVAMALHTRRTHFGFATRLDTTQITRTSRLVSNCTGMSVQPNKAVVGSNAFAHEAGIHQDGMLKHHGTYEIMRPETVGANRTRLVLGKHSGRHAFKVRLRELGFSLSDSELATAFERFKTLADKKKSITDADLEALVTDELCQPLQVYQIDGLQVACGTVGLPTATVRLRGPDGRIHVQAAVGTGPVDAVFKAIRETAGAEDSVLLEFSVHSVTRGIDALGEVSVTVQGPDITAGRALNPQRETSSRREYHGYGADTDIIVAGAKAYLAALNRLLTAAGRYQPRELPRAPSAGAFASGVDSRTC